MRTSFRILHYVLRDHVKIDATPVLFRRVEFDKPMRVQKGRLRDPITHTMYRLPNGYRVTCEQIATGDGLVIGHSLCPRTLFVTIDVEILPIEA